MKTRFYHSKEAPKPNKPIHLGAVALIRCKDSILLEKRADSERWSFIGGGLKMEESLEECIRREVLEETNLIVSNTKLIEVFSNPYRIAAYPDGNILRIVTALFDVKIAEFNSMICSEESRELRFFNKTEISQIKLAETHLDILKYINDNKLL
ncbi:MAG: NUDIX domain-containing protein [Lachnospiraceae bacterium]|nr:NUDIX domain-containing protein [Lachnospiraceae bacterium]